MLAEMGTFVDRQTFQWERTYPHPIERVWSAVTDEKELAVWMSPGCRVELRVGAECEFVWGTNVVTRLEPPHVFELAPPERNACLRFELEAVDNVTTRLRLINWYEPGAFLDPPDENFPGSDQPGGADSVWRPHFLSGFHAMLDFLRPHLDGEDVVFEPGNAAWHQRIPLYRERVSTQLPGGVLAQFVDRYTLRYDRFYAHPIERVFAAITEPEHMDKWMLPFNTVDPRAGGRFEMTFSGPRGEGLPGTLAEFAPPTLVDYAFDNGTSMRFELHEEEGPGGGTWLAFIHSFPPEGHNVPKHGDPQGDLPGGPDTPWRPGFVAGFHLQLDHLAPYLRTGDVASCEVCKAGWDSPIGRDHVWENTCAVYREHIRITIPTA